MTLLDVGEATCCYAHSDKYWLTDPQGIAWEQFHTLGNVPVFGDESPTLREPAAACCASDAPRGKPIGIAGLVAEDAAVACGAALAGLSRPLAYDLATFATRSSMSASTPSLFIATPCLDGNVNAHYAASLVRSVTALQQHGWRSPQIDFEIGNSLIADARNKLVARFLASAASDLVFIDADLSWSADDLVRLASHDAPFVAGVYQRKSRTKIDFTVKFGPTIGMDAAGLMTVERVGTGFMRLRRDCLEKMVAAHASLRLRNPLAKDDAHFYALFDTTIVDGQFIGEDFTFCDRWRAIGGQVLIDPAINLSHHGATAYDEPLLKYLQRN